MVNVRPTTEQPCGNIEAAGDAGACDGDFQGICESNLVYLALQEAVPNRSYVDLLTLNTLLPLATVNNSDSVRQTYNADQLDEDMCQTEEHTGRVLVAIGRKPTAVAQEQLIVTSENTPRLSCEPCRKRS